MANKKYPEYKQLNLQAIGKDILAFWQQENIFKKSLEDSKGRPQFVFYEGPPSANGMPGIHHVMARAIKDIFCRYKTLKGFHVDRKAGWDTHGLPIELAVEKTLGITKEDIGKKISVDKYNAACRKEVMRYKDKWDELTEKIGYWVDLDNPYITFDNAYMETCWYLLAQLYKKGLLYKGYTIQPYSPAAGTGLSSHELNQPGCYRNVKDNSVVAQFKVRNDVEHPLLKTLFTDAIEVFFLAWTTTPWTLPSNTALAVGKDIDYVLVQTFNPYTYLPVKLILAKALFGKYFPEKNAELALEDYEAGAKAIPFKILTEFKGSDLAGLRYEQLLPYVQPEEGDAFRVVVGDFVTTEDGTGIVHIAPSFGADDFKVAKQNGIGALTLVTKEGRFVPEMGEFANRFVKAEYAPDYDPSKEESVDIDIIIKLKKENRAFKSEKYEHSYPHCWRTDKPILYYPLDSWFIRTTALKDRLIELNKTINWKPEATGTGRFGNWLENLVDWNLSRSRYWGTPLPIWVSEDKTEEICIESAAQLKQEIEKSIAAGFMTRNPLEKFREGDTTKENYETFDLHRPYVDDIVLVSPTGKKMTRETDLIDVWFDSGAMPYAQLAPLNLESLKNPPSPFPADFIAEGVDQTRGWFFTLHAIATMCFDSVAFKTVVSNGLVLDKAGNKMSKRLGNAIDPFEVIEKYGPDALRWYMITNSQPWDNLKFDLEGVAEVQRKFFGTLYNTYSFFALYANIDGFAYEEKEIPYAERPEIDRWILSELNTLIQTVDEAYSNYEPTIAGRSIAEFVDAHLSNWYVRLSRRRFWKGEYTADKLSAYQTLYSCLETVIKLAAPIAPFFTERLFADLNSVTHRNREESVHLTGFPIADENKIDKALEERMELAQQISSMVLSLRKKNNLRVRQPLQKILIPVTTQNLKDQIELVSNLIKNEVNIKEIEYLMNDNGFLVKKIKANFKTLGARCGKQMKDVAATIAGFSQSEINTIEQTGKYEVKVQDLIFEIGLADVEIITEDIPGWVVANQGTLTVALDTTITPELWNEGIARELVNRIQNLRKDKGLEVTDQITLLVEKNNEAETAIVNNLAYICSETLAQSLDFSALESVPEKELVELTNEISIHIALKKV